MKRKQVSSEAHDPSLNDGIAFFVQEKEYKSFLAKFGKLGLEERSTCNNHEALAKASTKHTHGLASTGIVTVECTRHDMKRPCSIGDMLKGERFDILVHIFPVLNQ